MVKEFFGWLRTIGSDGEVNSGETIRMSSDGVEVMAEGQDGFIGMRLFPHAHGDTIVILTVRLKDKAGTTVSRIVPLKTLFTEVEAQSKIDPNEDTN